MKKYRYIGLALAVTLALSACSSVEERKKTEPTTTVVEQNSEAVETESSAQENEDAKVQVEVRLPYAPLNVELSAKYEGEWDDKGAIITADSATIHILDDGYERLKETLEEYNKENWQEVYRVYVENREYAREDDPQEGMNLYISREIEVTRADEKILSFVNAESSFMGGAHGSYYENAEVFDVESGKALELREVVTDYDKVYSYVVKTLKENYEKEMFFDGYEEWLEEMFYEQDGAMSSPVEWNMSMDGVTIRFNPYILGPWASGSFEVEIPYDGNEALFVEAYLPVMAGGKIRKIEPEEKIKIDTDRNGDLEVIYFNISEMSEEYQTTVKFVRHEDEDMLGNYSTKTEEYYGAFIDAYLVEVPDELNEGENFYYLYAEFMDDNDFRKLFVIGLNEHELGNHRIFENIGETEASVYGHMIADTGQFALYSRADILGTYNGYMMYSVGEDGMPKTEDTVRNLVTFGADWERVLTSKRELTVLMHVDGSDERVEEKLPKGTKFKPRKTDGETMVEMELEDGRRCDILVERPEDEYAYYIDGVSEYDCFEDIPYAG